MLVNLDQFDSVTLRHLAAAKFELERQALEKVVPWAEDPS